MDFKPTSPFLIYVLHHPDSLRVYIGKSSSGMTRPSQHFDPSHLRTCARLPSAKWIQSLRKRGLEPQISILEEVATQDGLNEAECFYIAYFRSLGTPLLNLTDGGDGAPGYKPTAEALQNMSAAQRRRIENTPGAVGRLTSMSNEYWSDEAARDKKSAERTGQQWSPETKAKMSASAKGKPKSAEHRANIAKAAAIAMKRRWENPVFREQQRQMQLATKAKKSEAVKRAWEDAEYRKRNLENRHKKKEDDPE